MSITFQIDINGDSVSVFQTKNSFSLGDGYYFLGVYFSDIAHPSDAEIQVFDLGFSEQLRRRLFENRASLDGLDL